MPHPNSVRDQLQEARRQLELAEAALAEIDALPIDDVPTREQKSQVATILRRYRISLNTQRQRAYDRQVANAKKARREVPSVSSSGGDWRLDDPRR